MPIYEYQCKACSHEFETIQRFSDPVLTDCPRCERTNVLRKLVSRAAFRLKGSGWYETDFKGGKRRNVAGDAPAGGEGSGTAASAGGSGGGESAAASKPAAAEATNGGKDASGKSGAKGDAKGDAKGGGKSGGKGGKGGGATS